MLKALDPVFRLHAWTVHKHKGQFYISKADRPTNWGRAYSSLTRACNAIARKIEREWTQRSQNYGRQQ